MNPAPLLDSIKNVGVGVVQMRRYRIQFGDLYLVFATNQQKQTSCTSLNVVTTTTSELVSTLLEIVASWKKKVPLQLPLTGTHNTQRNESAVSSYTIHSFLQPSHFSGIHSRDSQIVATDLATFAHF